ncbi:MAG TPA: VTT domain-containing protein [Candidatus Babeliales bacterium]|nr:VTT domain-containing protein [Candidatus Babeliales bacterium]
MIAQALLASTAIILLSFISEDAATISSALSLFGGPITWPLGFAACFAGIWLGDLGLYSLARYFGQPVLKSRWIARFADATAIERCEIRFNTHASLTLLASRFVPGTRLPTYLAAGLLSMPMTKFAGVTAFGALLWIGGIFAIAKLLGSQPLVWLSFVQGKVAGVILTAVVLGTGLLVFKKLVRAPGWAKRWTHWEFWPAWLFYLPVGVYYAWLAIRHRGLCVPTSANPGIVAGGFVGESKLQILDQLRRTSSEFTADAYSVEGHTTTERLLCLHRLCREHEITLPFILKPDVGQRGNGVKVIRSMRSALEYLQAVEAPVIVQRYIAGPCEAGVFYYRFPDEPRGHIFAITEKIFPTIRGDGIHTIEELIRADRRAALVAQTYLRRFASRLDEVLATGEILKLVETGNHAQGCIFRDGMHLHTEAMERVFDSISQKVTGFFIGRYDVRYENEEDFKAGCNFQIVELNGATSEATSIYDSRNSLFSAYRTLFEQWRLVFAIGAINKTNGHAPASLATLWCNWRQYSAAALSYPLAD